MYDRVKGENPTAKITEITKIISDMWQAVDPATKDRLEAEYRRNKEAAALEKADYEQKYGKIERKKKKKRIDKAQKGEWSAYPLKRKRGDWGGNYQVVEALIWIKQGSNQQIQAAIQRPSPNIVLKLIPASSQWRRTLKMPGKLKK